ncbi:MAG: hypothetical protein RIB80_04750 [Rhodospirillales bacterium]
MMQDVDQTLERVRAFWRHEYRGSKSGLAVAAGLSDGTLRAIDKQKWNPTVETLRAIEAIIPLGWAPQPENSQDAA